MTNQFSAIPDPIQDSFDTGPLSWVIGEIRDSLARSKNAIFEGVNADDEGKSTLLAHAKSYLHQAHGALQIVDVDGVAIITETVEDILERIKAGSLPFSQVNAEAIARGYSAVVEYLEELLAGSQPQPVRLFPYYRGLLEVRGAERIHPADLFFPNLAIRPHLPPNPAPATKVDYTNLRLRFEKALLPFLKNGEKEKATPLVDVIAMVERSQDNSQSHAFWWVMAGFAETVAAGQVPSEQFVKQLFGRINLQIRRLAEGSTSISERLLRDALFFIARASDPTPRAKQIRSVYQLDGLVPKDYERPRYGQIDLAALQLAKDHLNQAKTVWSRIADDDANMWPAFEQEMQILADASTKLNAPSLPKLLRELNGIARHCANGLASIAASVAGTMCASWKAPRPRCTMPQARRARSYGAGTRAGCSRWPQNFEAAKTRFSFNPETGLYRANPLERSATPSAIHVDVAPLEGSTSTTVAPTLSTNVPHEEAVLTVEEELVLHEQQSKDLAASVAANPEDLNLQAQLKESLQQVRKDAALLDNAEAKGRAQAAIDKLESPDFVASQEASRCAAALGRAAPRPDQDLRGCCSWTGY
ncbi:MAG: hypothetical protein HYZ45_13520 [Burkholderiales bacterium]|nr:hypothetical protein [Burkholderiales bacterium]